MKVTHHIYAQTKENLNLYIKNVMTFKKPGKEPEILCLDVSTKLDAVKPKIEALIEKFQRIDILINNAGISYRGEVNLKFDRHVAEKCNYY